MYLGSWKIDDVLTFTCNTHTVTTGAATDADSVPTYRVYEDETGTPILTGSTALLDDANTTGFYSEQITLSAANGFEKGKTYTIYMIATVDSIAATMSHSFQIEAEVDANALSASAVDDIWDEVLTSGSHDVGYSAGQRLRYLILTGASAQAGSATTITLANAESATDNIFNENIISIVSGTGAGQTRLIAEYDGDNRIATVDRPWTTNPASGSVYEILPFSSILLSDHGTATAGGNTSITLASTASAVDDTYVGSVVYVSSGTGEGQVRLITAYDGDSKVATISDAWATNPASGSVYKVLPVGRVIVDSMKDDAITAAKIAADAITSSELADGAITAAKIATDAITAAKIAADAITSSEIADGAITAAKIATDAITAAKIAADAITSSELAASAANEIADAVLVRGAGNVEDSAEAASLAELILAAFESAVADTVWTIYKTDHSTTFSTRTVTTDANAQPITEVT